MKAIFKKKLFKITFINKFYFLFKKAIIEKVLLILWRHIEFYLSNFDSINESYQLFRSDFYNVDQMENLKRYGIIILS